MKQAFVFSAPWCGNCKVLKAKLDNDNTPYTYVDIEDEDNQPLAELYGIRGLPTTVIVEDGHEVGRFVGVKPAEIAKAVA